MFATLRKRFSWKPLLSTEKEIPRQSLILAVFMKLLEDVLFWKFVWLSVSFIISWHIIFLVGIIRNINLLQFIQWFLLTALLMDAFESWLKHKHRTACLKRVANPEPTQLYMAIDKASRWLGKKWSDFVHIRETNHTKAFLVANLILWTIFFIGKYMSIYFIVYIALMICSISYKIASPIHKVLSHMLQDIESEAEFEGLIPEASDINIKLLSIESEKPSKADAQQSLDYWQPEDIPIEEGSDNSDSSSSIATNFSMEKVLQKDVESSDSSEDDYIPLDHKNQLQSTLEVVEPANTWGASAYNALWNITSAVTNMIQSEKDTKRKRVSSVDSSDGFEMVDGNEIN